MGLFNRIFKKKKDNVPVFIGKSPSKIGKPKKNKYKAECTLKFNDQAVRVFPSYIKAYTRDQAAREIEEGYEIVVTKIHKIK